MVWKWETPSEYRAGGGHSQEQFVGFAVRLV